MVRIVLRRRFQRDCPIISMARFNIQFPSTPLLFLSQLLKRVMLINGLLNNNNSITVAACVDATSVPLCEISEPTSERDERRGRESFLEEIDVRMVDDAREGGGRRRKGGGRKREGKLMNNITLYIDHTLIKLHKSNNNYRLHELQL